MKTINDYSIYCTETQTKKALELGATLDKIAEYTVDKTICDRFHFLVIDEVCYANPTAEEMVGWLEEQESIKGISIYCDVTGLNWYFEGYKDNGGYAFVSRDSYCSRKEATLAAIDAALEYLMNKK